MASVIVRNFIDDLGFQGRQVQGWRATAINQCLDYCAKVPGYTTVQWSEDERRDFGGRFVRLWENPADCKRAWARNNVEKARANSLVQWKRQDERMRAEYAECSKLYLSIYPNAAMPGYDGWRRNFRRKWLSDRALALASMHSWKCEADKAKRYHLWLGGMGADAPMKRSATDPDLKSSHSRGGSREVCVLLGGSGDSRLDKQGASQ